MKRTFIALPVNLDKHLISILQQIRMELRNEKIRWVRSENLHFTLAFLGNTHEEDQKQVQQIIRQIAGRFPVFSFKIRGLSAFPSLNKPRVIWSGVEHPETLMDLQVQLYRSLQASTSLVTNNKKFIPHLTLARIKYMEQPDKFSSGINRFRKNFHQEVPVNEIIYYESVLNPEGPVYQLIDRFSLRGGRQ